MCLSPFNNTKLLKSLDWSNSVDNWSYQKMLEWFINTTHQECLQLIAKALLDEYKITLQSMSKAALAQEAALVQATPEVR